MNKRLVLSLLAAMSVGVTAAAASGAEPIPAFAKQARILFQGDSITDGKLREIVARLAKKHGAALVKFQRVFDDACRRAPAEYWIWDGVHPTYRGHQLMADEWERAVREFWPESAK